MKRFALIAAAAAALAAPAVFAQGAVVVEGGTVIFEGPATSKPINGAVIAQAPVLVAPGTVLVAPSTTVLGAGPAVVTTTSPSSVTVVRHYWNVPPNINSRMDFRRWQQLL
jgi:hypothetical protein